MNGSLQRLAAWMMGGIWMVLATLMVSAQPVVSLSVDPDSRQISIGATATEIYIIAKITPPDSRWVWSCQGPGQCLGNLTEDIGILYVSPTALMEPSANVIITLTVTDSQNRTTVEHVRLTLQREQPPPPSPVATPSPIPEPTLVPTPTPSPLLPQKTALLTVRSNVRDDTVFIDGKKYGATRLDQELPVGKHLIRVEKAGCTPYQETIELQAALTIRAVLTCPTWNTAVWDQTQWQ